MPATQTEQEGMAQAFTPFQESYAFEAEPSTPGRPSGFEAPSITPFVSEYAGEADEAPASGELRDLLFELYDEQFDEALADLAHEAWQAATERAAPFAETGGGPGAAEFLHEWIRPLHDAAEQMLDGLAAAASEHDLASMGEAEVDRFLDRLEPQETGLEAHFENFFRSLWNKAKSLTKAAITRGLTLIPGIGPLIDKLKRLVLGPVLRMVLKAVDDKLPPELRPYAHQLAGRVLGAPVGEAETAGEDAREAPAATDPSAIQRELDVAAATLLLAPGEDEQEVTVGEAVQAAERDGEATVAELHEARERFVAELEAGTDPKQAMEQFIPAVMAILPIARKIIGLIGRSRVRGVMADILNGFVSRYLPKEAASRLSTAIADAGLRMLSLEAPAEHEGEGTRLAYETIAQTVEDTVRRVAAHDETVFEDEVSLEAAMTEAFQEAAAENFPPEVILPELHEAPLRATWVLMPRRARRHYYKKYTHVFDVEITPQAGETVTTFRGARLGAVLRDQLGVSLPVRARVHLYQAIPGTTLRRIASLERGVPGLGGARHGAKLLHPLTVRAAATLLGHPRLGRDVAGPYLASRRNVAVGQRFYFLEIAGARPVMVASGAPGAVARPATTLRRTTGAVVKLDFVADEFRVALHLSEADAQALAGEIRNRNLTGALVRARQIAEPALRAALDAAGHGHVHVRLDGAPAGAAIPRALDRVPEVVRRRLADRMAAWLGAALAEYLKTGAGELTAATEDPADGVTIVVAMAGPPGSPALRRLLRGEGIDLRAPGAATALFEGRPRLSVRTVPGYRHA